MSHPVESHVSEHIHEANQGHNVGDSSTGGIGDSTLDWWEDCSARYTHHENTGTATCVTAQVGCAESEESGVHRGLEEEDDNEDSDSGGTVASADVGVKSNSEGSVDHEQEISLEDSRQSSGDEAADSKGNQGVGQHL